MNKSYKKYIRSFFTILCATTLLINSILFLPIDNNSIHTMHASATEADTLVADVVATKTDNIGTTSNSTTDTTITKGIFLKTSMGTYGTPGYYSTDFYTKLDYNDSWLTTDIKSNYNYGLAKFASILSGYIYDGVSCMIDSPEFTEKKTEILEAFGFDDVTLFSISNAEGNDIIDTEDVTTIVIGHKVTTVSSTETHDAYIVVIRGTTGASEWESNYDVGCIGSDYTDKTGDHPEWTDFDNHKGFDVVANRVIALLDDYVASHSTDNSTIDYMITGHSRGAGIANIVGAKLEAEGRNSCAYTYASPNTTTNPDKLPSNTVFNIINSNDYITTLPLTEWGFSRYGTDIAMDVANDSNARKIVEDSIGMDYDGQDPYFLTGAFVGLASSRDELYADEIIDCAFDTLEEKNQALNASRTAIEYLGLENFSSFEDYSTLNADGKYHYTQTLCPGTLMVGMSRIMSLSTDYTAMFTTMMHLQNAYPKDSKYTQALSDFLTSLSANLIATFYPHMTTCYFAIVESNHLEETASSGTSSNNSSGNGEPVEETTANTGDNSDVGDSSQGFVGSITFYIVIALIVSANVLIAIALIRKSKKKEH